MSTASLVFDVIAKDRASSTFDKIGSKASGAGSKLGTFAKAGIAAFSAGAIVEGGKAVFNYAAELEQMGAKAKTVFGSQLGTVDKWASKNAHAMGLTTRAATGLAANFADLLIPMGFTRQKAAEMSTKVVGLAGALSQWSGGTKSASEVTEILNSAMLGETDGLKSLGISISAADVAAQLLAKGQDKLTGAAKQQAEAQAIQSLIFAKSTDAQAAFAKGGSPLLSAQMKLKGALGEVRDTLIAKLIPALSSMGTWFVDKGLPAISKFGHYLGDTFGPVIGKIVSWVKDKLLPALMSAYQGALPALKSAFESVQKALKSAQPFFETVGRLFVDVLVPIMGHLARIVLPLLGTALELIGKELGLIGKAGRWMWNNVLQPVFHFFIEAVGKAIELVADMLDGLSHVPGFGWVKNAADALHHAAGEAQGLADAVQKIPSRKDVTVNVKLMGDLHALGIGVPSSIAAPRSSYNQTGKTP